MMFPNQSVERERHENIRIRSRCTPCRLHTIITSEARALGAGKSDHLGWRVQEISPPGLTTRATQLRDTLVVKVTNPGYGHGAA
jgi:hypothetical protein